MNADDFKEWCQRHNIHILNTDKRAYRWTKQNIKFFQDPADYNLIHEKQPQMETEPLYTIEVTLSELERIAEFEQQVFNNLKQSGHYNMFETLVKQKQDENHLRNKYSAVQKAYEHYSLLLKLAQSGEL